MRKIGCRWNCSGVGHPSPCSTHPHGTRTLYSLYLLYTKTSILSVVIFSVFNFTLLSFARIRNHRKDAGKIPIRRERYVRTCVRLPPPSPSMPYCLSLFKSDPIISHRFPFNRPEQKHFSNKFFLVPSSILLPLIQQNFLLFLCLLLWQCNSFLSVYFSFRTTDRFTWIINEICQQVILQ